jgi:hypothetical protein
MKALLSKNPSYINDNQYFKDSSHVIRVKKRQEDKGGGGCDMYSQKRNAQRGFNRKD